MSGLDVSLWDEVRFGAAQEEWSNLLASSDSDPLFMSWQWQWNWWRHHREALSATLAVLAVSRDGTLIGLAPFMMRRVRMRKFLAIRRLELIGGTWRDDAGSFSEYLDVIAAREESTHVVAAVSRWLREQDEWHEAAFACVRPTSVAARVARAVGPAVHVREVDAFHVHRLALPAQFSEYVSRLSSACRRKLSGQRSRLVDPHIVAAGAAEAEAFLGRMDEMIRRRWSRDPLSPASRAFRADLCRDLAARGELRLTALMSEGQPVSILYDVRVGEIEYYLQSGFDGSRSAGLSPGYLHLGYAIERACGEGVRHFDLLGGHGMNRDYKRDFDAVPELLSTLHIIRAAWLRAAYRLTGRS